MWERMREGERRRKREKRDWSPDWPLRLTFLNITVLARSRHSRSFFLLLALSSSSFAIFSFDSTHFSEGGQVCSGREGQTLIPIQTSFSLFLMFWNVFCYCSNFIVFLLPPPPSRIFLFLFYDVFDVGGYDAIFRVKMCEKGWERLEKV